MSEQAAGRRGREPAPEDPARIGGRQGSEALFGKQALALRRLCLKLMLPSTPRTSPDDDAMLRAGRVYGLSFLLPLTAEFALKALLHTSGKEVNQHHDLLRHWRALPRTIRDKVQARAHVNLNAFFEKHRSDFTGFRYKLGDDPGLLSQPTSFDNIICALLDELFDDQHGEHPPLSPE